MSQQPSYFRQINTHNFKKVLGYSLVCSKCYSHFREKLPEDVGYSVIGYTNFGKCTYCGITAKGMRNDKRNSS